MKVLVKLSV